MTAKGLWFQRSLSTISSNMSLLSLLGALLQTDCRRLPTENPKRPQNHRPFLPTKRGPVIEKLPSDAKLQWNNSISSLRWWTNHFFGERWCMVPFPQKAIWKIIIHHSQSRNIFLGVDLQIFGSFFSALDSKCGKKDNHLISAK